MLRLMGKPSFHKGITMPTAVRIKATKYGRAIRMLLERGGMFQTRHQYTLIVNSEQRKILEEADLVETNGVTEGTGGKHAKKKDAR
jgi:hypothetical protein